MTRAQELEAAVKKLLDCLNIRYMRVENYVCYKCHTVQNREAKGWPDYFCLVGVEESRSKTEAGSIASYLAIECKTGKGRLSPEQEEWRGLLTNRETTKYIVLKDNVDELIEYLKSIGYKIK